MPDLVLGSRGSRHSHCASVRSVGYGFLFIAGNGKLPPHRFQDVLSGYSQNQFHLMERKARAGEPFRVKHAMHLIRLLHSGLHAARTGEILVDVGEHRHELLAIRRGEWSWDEVAARRTELDAEFRAAFDASVLPESPDTARVNEFLVMARASAVQMPMTW